MKRLSILILMLFGSGTSFAQEWKLAKEQDGIIVYTKKEENSAFKTFKAIVEIDSPIEKVEKSILDFDSYPEWVYNVENVEIVKENANSIFVYLHLSAPWPVSDRDMILKHVCTKEHSKTLITMESYPSKEEEKDGLVRIFEAKGKWELNKIDNNKTKVIYQFLADPNGSLPSAIVNMFVLDGPLVTLNNLRNKL